MMIHDGGKSGARAGPETTSQPVDDDDVALGERIKQVRTERGLKRGQMAARIGVTSQAIVRWEKGYGVKRENLRKMADEFDLSYEWLLTGEQALSGQMIRRIKALPEFEARQFVQEIEYLLRMHEDRASEQSQTQSKAPTKTEP
jgi:transcriptional regulator with XRE-family HTH domain